MKNLGLGLVLTALSLTGCKASRDQIPGVVRASLDKEAKGGAIKDIHKATKDGKTIYEADVAVNGVDYQIKMSEDGALISKKIDDKDDENDGKSEEAPARGPKAGTPWIGLTAQPLLENEDGPPAGLLVTGTFPGSPAEKAGVVSGDVLQKIDGTVVRAPADMAVLRRHKAGDMLKLTVVRDGKPVEISVTLENYQAPEAQK